VAETVAGILDDLLAEHQVDAPRSSLLRDLNRRWAMLLNGARAYRKTASFGNTTANVPFYALAGVVELYDLYVDGAPYGKARRPDRYGYSQGTLLWVGPAEGLIVADADANAVKGITLIPTPGQSGLAISGFAAMHPPELTEDGAGNTLLNAHLESDLVPALTSGVLAERYRRDHRWDLVQGAESDFGTAVQELLRRTRRRFRNSGPTQIRVEGINA
jgi:hypothetical protein